ncbi:MAG: DUF2249 domain-containing protein [Nitrospirae bacterium]|nr:DUF2249 domain-containing protein [Nitrospirota bacterium]
MNATPTIVDVRAIPPRERHPQIFRTFDGLPPTGAFLLVNDHNPVPLLHQFRFERPHAFEWWPLEQGPEVWRVLIAKRAKAEPETIGGYLGGDHRRIEALWDDFRARLNAEDLPGARERFGEFSLGLHRHIEMEERILFPAFEERTGMSGAGPTVVMRDEHEEIRRLLEAIETGLGREGGVAAARDAVSSPCRELADLLNSHDQKEEGILYPTTDQLVDARAKADMVHLMRAI